MRRVREEAERQAGGLQLRDSRVVAQQSRSVSRVGIADGAQVFVVATEECGTTANPTRKLQDGSIDLMAKLDMASGSLTTCPAKSFGARVRKVC